MNYTDRHPVTNGIPKLYLTVKLILNVVANVAGYITADVGVFDFLESTFTG